MIHQNNNSHCSLWLLITAFFFLNIFLGIIDNCLAISTNPVEDLKGQLNPELSDRRANFSFPPGNSLSYYANMTSDNLAPLQTRSNSNLNGREVIVWPIKTKVGVELDQISAINQKDQNFDVVANIWMHWTDPKLAFSPRECNCSYKFYRSIDQFVQEYGSSFPEFMISNQQGNRWTQNEIIVVEPNGTATYFERFWVKLQAPDFNFRKYPLDKQDFYIRIDSLYPEDYYSYEI